MWQNHYCWCLYGHVCAFGLTFVSACGKITIADVCMAMFVPLVWRLSLHVAKSLLLMFVWPCLCLCFDVCLCMWQNHYCWCLYGHVCAFGLTFVSACGKITIADVCMAMFVPLVWRLSLHVAKSLLLMFVWPCLCLWFDVCLCMWQNHYCWCLYGHVCAFGLTFVSACGKITIADVCAFGLTFVSVCGTSVVCASVLVITGAHHTTFVWPACDFGVQTSVDGLHQLRSSRGSFLRGERSCTKPFKYFLGLCCCCVVTSVNSCQNGSFEIWCLGMVCTWSASLVCTVGCFAYVCVCVLDASSLLGWQLAD